MKNLGSMTPQELREYADKLEQENKPIKSAVLKHDIYYFGNWSKNYILDTDLFSYSKDQIDEFVEDFKNNFSFQSKKGTKFFYYKINEKTCRWYSEDGQIENVDEIFEKAHLENIVDLRNEP